MNAWTYWRWGNTISCVGVAQFLLAGGLAMLLYPGGTMTNPGTAGYSVTENYLSDLGRTVSLSGQGNRVGSLLFNGSLVVLALATLPFFFFVPRHLPDYGTALGWSALFGVFSAMGLLGVGLAPYNVRPWHHEFSLFFWGICFLIAVSLHAVAFFVSDRGHRHFGVLSTALAVLMAVYLTHCTAVAMSSTEDPTSAPHAQSALAQKYVVVGSILWFLVFSIRMMATARTERVEAARDVFN